MDTSPCSPAAAAGDVRHRISALIAYSVRPTQHHGILEPPILLKWSYAAAGKPPGATNIPKVQGFGSGAKNHQSYVVPGIPACRPSVPLHCLALLLL